MKRVGKFLLSGLLLSAMSLLMRAIAVALNVYLTGRIGAEGIGLFSLIMSVYGLGTALAAAGVGTAATRLVSEELAKPDGRPDAAAMRCLLYSALCGTAAGALLLCAAGAVGRVWLQDVRTVSSLRIMALSFPFIAISSSLTGYFTAVRKVWKSAVAQLFEQLLRISLCVVLLQFLAPRGLEYACVAIVGGGTVSEIGSALVMGVFFAARRKTKKSRRGVKMRRVTAIALPVAVAAWARAALNTIKQAMIPAGLQRFGLSREGALAQYGRITGMVLPVILFPSAFLYSYAGLLIPELTEFDTLGNTLAVHRVITAVLRVVIAFSLAAVGVFLLTGQQLGALLYSDAEAGKLIMLFAPLTVAMYLDSAVDGMLKGLNQHRAVMRINLLDSAATLLLVIFLVPRIGVSGYIAAIFLTEIMNAALSLNRLIKVSGYRANWNELAVKPLLCLAAAVAASFPLRRLAADGVGPTVLLALFGLTVFATALYALQKPARGANSPLGSL